VLIGGEAGIGKSRLIAEFADASARSRARIVRAECREFAQSPVGPLAEILKQLGESAAFLYDAQSQDAQVEMLLAKLAAVFDRRTTVVVIEDLHWASADLISTLRLLVTRVETQRALFVVSYRDNEIVPSHPNFIALGKLARERAVSSITLTRFEHDTTVELLERALGAKSRVPHVVVTDVARRSDGNPLYGEELLRHAVDHLADPTDTRDRVPLTLQAVVRERIEHCSSRERTLLERAALVGRDFDLGELASLSADLSAPTEPELSTLVDWQLLSHDRRTGRYAFRHALTRDVVYESIAGEVAQPFHRLIADALEAQPADALRVAEVAHHRWRSGDRARAAAPCESAGALARAQFAYADSIRWYERAIVAHGSDGAAAMRVRLELGKVLVAVEETARGVAAYETVAAWAQIRDVALFVRARRLIAGTIHNEGRREEAVAILETTLASIDPGAHASLAAGLTLRIVSMRWTGDDPATAWRYLDRLDPATLATEAKAEYFLLRSSLHALDLAADGPWRDDAAQTVTLYGGVGSPRFEHYARVQVGLQAFARGELTGARSSFEAADRCSVESAGGFNELPLSFAILEAAAGRFARVPLWLQRVRPSPQLYSRAMESLALVELALALDDVLGLERYADLGFVDELERGGDTWNAVRLGSTFARALVRLGRHLESDRLLEQVVPLARSTFDVVPAMLGIASLRPALTMPFRALLERDRHAPFLAAAASIVDAETARERGLAVDRDAVAAALTFYDEAGWLVLAARATELQGDDAEALRRYRAMGHVAGVRRLGISALRHSASDAAPLAATGALSRRECEIANLVAIGKSNREAATILAISEKTVEKYLTTIYGKLGLQSRVQLAAYVARDASS